MPMTDLQTTVYATTYSRWVESEGRRETWPETVTRVITFYRKHILTNYSNAYSHIPWGQLQQGMLDLEVLPSMRSVQMSGPAAEICNVKLYNCSYLPLKDWFSFAELLYVLMQGTGVGFSVEQQYISQLPLIETQGGMHLGKFTIPDTTEGWCDALHFGLTTWSQGMDVEFDYSEIRPYGTPLKTKGGRASGSEPLKNLLDFTRTLLLKHQGRKLSSLNCHDLACYCGSIVQVGGVRRAAEISLSDRNDEKMKKAKMGQFWLTAPERSMANNSAVYESKPTMAEFITDWVDLMNSGTGERGIFNREGVIAQLPERRAVLGVQSFGLNPC